MVDKIAAIHRERIGKRIGRLMDTELAEVERALSLWLGIAMLG